MRISGFCPSIDWSAMTILVVLLIATSAWGAEPAAREDTRKRGDNSLDRQLDELLLEDLGLSPKERPAGRGRTDRQAPSPGSISGRPGGKSQAGKPSHPSNERNMDEELLEGLEGEDVSLSSNPAEENPLVRLNQRMKQVEQRIAEARGDEKTQQLQHDISDDLSKLIAALDRQCRQCKKPASGSSRPKPGQPKAAANPAEQASERPAHDSSDRIDEKKTAKVDRARMQEMLKGAWGHLPVHLRQQMEQSANEEFLPKYELEIAEYYRSLLNGRGEKK